ncbi:branched-chain amino acid ABC transporter permease [Chloroflexota bacterium]
MAQATPPHKIIVMDILAINILNGVSYAMILFLMASGLSLIRGVMGILNLAHGTLYMLGAYIGLTVAGLGANWVVALLAGGVSAGIIGLFFERVFLSRLYKQVYAQVLLTLGLVYVFANVVLWIWGGIGKIGTAPAIAAGGVSIGDFSFPFYRFLLIFMGLLAFAGLWWLEAKTRAGAIIRAGMDDKEMTIGLGINYGLISSATFILGATMGGLAGFIGTPIVGAHPDMSMNILLSALIVVVVGGVGSVRGALLGALVIGLIDSFGKAYFPDFALFTIYLAMIIVLLLRPSGILGRAQ